MRGADAHCPARLRSPAEIPRHPEARLRSRWWCWRAAHASPATSSADCRNGRRAYLRRFAQYGNRGRSRPLPLHSSSCCRRLRVADVRSVVPFPLRRFSSVDPIGAPLDLRGPTPRHDRDRGGRILRRAFDQLVGVDHVDQHIAFGITAAHDLHPLEEQGAAPTKHVLPLLQFPLEVNRPTWRQASEMSETSSASPSQPVTPPRSGTVKWHATPSTSGSSRP